MKLELRSFSLLALAVAGAVLGIWWCCHETTPEVEGGGRDAITYRAKRSAEKGMKKARSEQRVGRVSSREKGFSEKFGQRKKVSEEIEHLSEDELQGLCKELMQELQDAANGNNLRRVRKIIALFDLPTSKGGLGGMVPRVLRMQAVAALDSCGAAAIPELLDFLADGSAEVADQAMEAIKDGMSDPELSDQDRADLLVTMMKGMVDGDDISMMLMDLNGMKDSIKGDALQRILESGSSQAQKIVKSELQIYTEIDVKDAESLREWTDKARKLEAGQDEVIRADTEGSADADGKEAETEGPAGESTKPAPAANEAAASGR